MFSREERLHLANVEKELITERQRREIGWSRSISHLYRAQYSLSMTV